MRYLSVCSGIEAASVAWHPLGWTPAAFSEIEAFPRAVLKHHYPDVPLHGDFTTIEADQYGPVDLLVGGTPCQSFSVAGLRGGLADDRGNLALGFLRLAHRTRARWVVWENVPGVLSSNGGRDFGSILGGLAELGYGFAYRVLDAQYVRVDGYARAVPQRRRRVFVVGHIGDWRRAAAVLLERESLSGNPAPRREARERAAPTIGSGPPYSRTGNSRVESEALLVAANALTERPDRGGGNSEGQRLVVGIVPDISNAICSRDYKGTRPEADQGAPLVPMAFSCKDHGADAGEVAPTLRSMGHDGSHANGGGQVAVAFAHQGGGVQTTLGYDPETGTVQTLGANQTPAVAIDVYNHAIDGDVTATLSRHSGEPNKAGPKLMQGLAVRRLTPRECERLQGFPDDYTLVPHRGKPAADGPRYKALGNSMACNVMRWIGYRIAQVEQLRGSQP